MMKTKKLTFLALMISFAMILSYVEFLLPPLFSAVPGIKIGLANIAIIFILYKVGHWEALCVSVLRVLLSALLFGTVLTLAYSLAGALLSFLAMVIAKRLRLFSTVGVSVIGGVSHNIGQIIVAAFVLATKEIAYYLAVLAVTGTVAGVLIGLTSALLISKINLKKQ